MEEAIIAYGIYDIAENKGWFSVGINHDTSEFAANVIRRPATVKPNGC
jgi:hypothetical protein